MNEDNAKIKSVIPLHVRNFGGICGFSFDVDLGSSTDISTAALRNNHPSEAWPYSTDLHI
jgi:hypothetical protein